MMFAALSLIFLYTVTYVRTVGPQYNGPHTQYVLVEVCSTLLTPYLCACRRSTPPTPYPVCACSRNTPLTPYPVRACGRSMHTPHS